MLSPHQTCKRCSMSSEWQVKYSERGPLQRCFEQTSSPSSTFHSEYCQTAPTCLVTVVTGTRSLVLDSTPLRSKNQKLSVSFLLKASSSSVSTRNADMAGHNEAEAVTANSWYKATLHRTKLCTGSPKIIDIKYMALRAIKMEQIIF